MKNTPLMNSSLSSKRMFRFACSIALFAAAGWLLLWPTAATTQSSFMRSLLGLHAPKPAIPVQSTTSTFYLHGTGPVDNPPTLFLNATAPTATAEKFKDSASINRNGGNPWKEVGTWPATAAMTAGSLTSLSDLHVWLGLKNSDDQGTYFDLRVEAYKNSTLVASGQSLCITGVTRNATAAKEVVLGFDPFSPTSFNSTSDVLKLKVLTRVGSTAAGGSCGGHNNAVGLRLYFDAVARASRFNAAISTSSDTTPPVLTVAQPVEGLITAATQITVSGTFSDQSPTTISVNGVNASLQGNNFSATVPLVAGANALNVAAVDAAGNQTQVTRNVVNDSVAPSITIGMLSEREITNASEITLNGSYSDATVVSITVNGVSATLTGGDYTASVPLAEGANTITVSATDSAGNHSELVQSITRDSLPPSLTVQTPSNGSITREVLVTGNTSDLNLLSSGVTINGNSTAVAQDGSFAGAVLLPDGENEIEVVATDSAGNLNRVVRTVNVDTAPPVIGDLEPQDNQLVESPATVRGRVTDATHVSVSVNGLAASVASDGWFTAENVILAQGNNSVSLKAVDEAGNESTTSLLLRGRDTTKPGPPVVFAVTSPTRLTMQTVDGTAEPGAQIIITGSHGPVTTQAAIGTGLFAANVELNPGVNNLAVTATDAEGNTSDATNLAVTSDSSLPSPANGQAAQINISAGNTQKGLVGAELPRPLIVRVTDPAGQPVSNAMIHFSVQAGGGSFLGGGSTTDALTDDHGRASVRYVSGVLGPQMMRADFTGNTLAPAAFMAEALQSASAGATTVSGIILDQNLRALPNVLIRLGGQETRTGADGRFNITDAAAGPHQLLEVIGRDQVPFPGRWPNITYDFDVLPGVRNDLGRPLFLPKVNDGITLPLDANNIVTRDTAFELPVAAGEPRIRVLARAGTHIIFPPDVTDKRLSVTRIATNRVPMTLEDGRATNLYISVQPAGAIFDQPLQITFPNLDRLPPGSEALLMSFDHDAGRYVQVGTGHVSGDGSSVTSDAGSGIRVGAWHAFPPDPPKPEVTVLGYIQLKDNPAFEGKHIDSAEAWVEGSRAVPLDLLPPPQATGEDGTSAPAAADDSDLPGSQQTGPDLLRYRATFAMASGTAHLTEMESSVLATTSEVKLSPRDIFVEVGKKTTVTAKLTPTPTKANANFTYTWSSGDNSLATVEASRQRPQYSASITGVTAGRTTIKVRYQFPDNSTTEDEVTLIVIKLEVKRTGVSRATAEADPPTSSEAEFVWETLQPNIAHVAYEDATFAYSNPNSATVTSFAPGLATLRLTFRFNLKAPPIVKTVQVPVFRITCYVIALESDYANNCTNVQNPHGLVGTYCQQFLMDVRLQGSGRDNNGNLIQIDYSQGNFGAGYATTYFHVVNSIQTASGRPLGNNSIAVDRNYIPLGTSVEIDGLGTRSADDTGGAINGYHIDYFNGFGRAVCHGWANPAKLAKCDPTSNSCP